MGHPSEIVNLPEDDSKGGPPTSANNYGTPNTDLQMNLSPNRHIKVYADTCGRATPGPTPPPTTSTCWAKPSRRSPLPAGVMC